MRTTLQMAKPQMPSAQFCARQAPKLGTLATPAPDSFRRNAAGVQFAGRVPEDVQTATILHFIDTINQLTFSDDTAHPGRSNRKDDFSYAVKLPNGHHGLLGYRLRSVSESGCPRKVSGTDNDGVFAQPQKHRKKVLERVFLETNKGKLIVPTNDLEVYRGPVYQERWKRKLTGYEQALNVLRDEYVPEEVYDFEDLGTTLASGEYDPIGAGKNPIAETLHLINKERFPKLSLPVVEYKSRKDNALSFELDDSGLAKRVFKAIARKLREISLAGVTRMQQDPGSLL